jgi:hypothetical protein
MSSIEENAFQVARYLLENPSEIEQVGIQNALDLSEEDFKTALEYLVPRYFLTGGQRGKGVIRQKNFAELQEFVNRINERRIPLSRDSERLLKLLFTDQSDFPFSIGDHVMAKFNWAEVQYVQVAQELSDKGFVRGEYASGNPFFQIFILPSGRETVRSNFNLPNQRMSSIQALNNIVDIDNTISHHPVRQEDKQVKDHLKQFRIFIASPSDVANERKKLETVVNSLKPTADHFGVVLRVVDWHTVVPDAGIAQQVIFDQLKPTSWDIFVGVLWHRFGMPPGMKDKTGKDYLSGTEAEFKTAYELWKHHHRPRIMMYRCTRAIPSNVDLTQAQRVKDFFYEIENPSSEFRVFTKSFATLKSFEELWRNDLQELLALYDKDSKTQ